jgi:hypothetical protein
MKRYIRHIVGPIFFLLVLGGTILFVTSAHFGALTLEILDQVGGVNIDYEDISGNILQGFRIKNYHVSFAETDSVSGSIANIHYRFNPFMLRLPNLFEINLVEPTIIIQEKRGLGGGDGFRGLPNLRFGLRINLKNGKVIYKSEETYKIDRISGIVFLDFAGRGARIATMNLSLQSSEHSVYIRSLVLEADVDNEQIRLNSFKCLGAGFTLEGSGLYRYQPRYADFNLTGARVDLEKLHRHQGIMDFTGNITYSHGSFQPRIRGMVSGFLPFDEFRFETNAAVDTIWVNVFDGKIWGGSLFAQLRVSELKDIEFLMNFKDLDISKFVGTEAPMVSSGYLSYADRRFSGFVSSPQDLELDSLYFFGTYAESELHLDSLFVAEGRRSLYAEGAVLPMLDVDIDFDDFDIGRFSEYYPLGGRLNGSVKVTGEPRELAGLTLTSSLLAYDLSIHGLSVDTLMLSSIDFQKDREKRYMSVKVYGLRYQNYQFSHTGLRIEDSLFSLIAADKADSIFVDGILRDDLKGTICSLLVNYNEVITSSVEPIDFDILRRTLGTVNLALADGLFFFSRIPLAMEFSRVDLGELGKLLGVREDMRGTLDLHYLNDSIRINGHGIGFMGLENGVLEMKGHYSGGFVIIESLHIHDDKAQVLDAYGRLSFDYSELTARFSDVGVWVLAFLENFMGDPTGLMSGEAEFRGNIDRFELSGGGRIHDGSFSVPVIASQFDSVDTDVLFEGDRIVFATGRGLISPKNGRESSKQWVSGGGVVKLEERFRVDNLNFDFSFIDAPLQFPPFAYGIGSGNFSMSMRDRVMYYNGNITVTEAVIPLEFGMKIEEEQAAQDQDWHVNLRLKAERNVWLRNPDADIEFGGEVTIVREDGPVFLSGILETDRGNYYWVNHILNITQGKVTFIPGDEIDPDLDFWAEMNTREGIKIILHLFGPISEPIFEFYTDPPGQYTEQDIVTYLNLNITWQELEQLKRGEYMSRIIPHSLLSWLEGDVSRAIRRYTGLDYFHIETPFFEEGDKAKLTVGKFIARNLFVTYTYDVTTFSNEFNVEYFIDDKNKIQVERDETGEYSLQYQYRLRF